MNTYGKFAQNAWKTLAPSQYELIVDPEAWFTDLGKEAENAVDSLSVQIAGPDSPGESYLEKVGRLTAAKMQAEEIVRAEMLNPQPEDLAENTEEDEDQPSIIGEHLEFMKEMKVLQRDLMEQLNREEMERGLNT